MKKKVQTKLPEVASLPVDHTFNGLRDMLFDEINLLRAGKISTARAKATSQLTRRVIEVTTLDLYAQALLGDKSVKALKRLINPNMNA